MAAVLTRPVVPGAHVIEVADGEAVMRGASAAGPNLSALAAITDAVQAGAGLPEILRAAAGRSTPA